MLFLDEIPGLLSVVGALLVVTSVLLTGARKWLDGLPSHDPMRQRLRFLTL